MHECLCCGVYTIRQFMIWDADRCIPHLVRVTSSSTIGPRPIKGFTATSGVCYTSRSI